MQSSLRPVRTRARGWVRARSFPVVTARLCCEVNLGQSPKVGKKVAVVGGGNVAVTLRSAKAWRRDVTIVYRRSR
jgi:NADPH-dependent glutamate synthase beta subunit-like oxidoreductase